MSTIQVGCHQGISPLAIPCAWARPAIKVLTGQGASIDTTKAEGGMIFAVFAALAEFERELIRERTKAGMVVARPRGIHVGRPRKLTPQVAEAKELIGAGEKSRADVAAPLGVNVATVRRALKTP